MCSCSSRPAQLAQPGAILPGHQHVRRRRAGSLGRLPRRSQQGPEIEPLRRHLQRTVGISRPLAARPIPVELEAVAIRVAQIERLADAVIAGAVERHRGVAKPAQRVAERGPIRVADRKVIETGRPRRGRSAALALPGVQADVVVIAAGAQEGGRLSHPLRHFEAQHAGVERKGAFQVRHFEMDMPDVGTGMNRVRHTSMIAHLRGGKSSVVRPWGGTEEAVCPSPGREEGGFDAGMRRRALG